MERKVGVGDKEDKKMGAYIYSAYLQNSSTGDDSTKYSTVPFHRGEQGLLKATVQTERLKEDVDEWVFAVSATAKQETKQVKFINWKTAEIDAGGDHIFTFEFLIPTDLDSGVWDLVIEVWPRFEKGSLVSGGGKFAEYLVNTGKLKGWSETGGPSSTRIMEFKVGTLSIEISSAKLSKSAAEWGDEVEVTITLDSSLSETVTVAFGISLTYKDISGVKRTARDYPWKKIAVKGRTKNQQFSLKFTVDSDLIPGDYYVDVGIWGGWEGGTELEDEDGRFEGGRLFNWMTGTSIPIVIEGAEDIREHYVEVYSASLDQETYEVPEGEEVEATFKWTCRNYGTATSTDFVTGFQIIDQNGNIVKELYIEKTINRDWDAEFIRRVRIDDLKAGSYTVRFLTVEKWEGSVAGGDLKIKKIFHQLDRQLNITRAEAVSAAIQSPHLNSQFFSPSHGETMLQADFFLKSTGYTTYKFPVRLLILKAANYEKVLETQTRFWWYVKLKPGEVKALSFQANVSDLFRGTERAYIARIQVYKNVVAFGTPVSNNRNIDEGPVEYEGGQLSDELINADLNFSVKLPEDIEYQVTLYLRDRNGSPVPNYEVTLVKEDCHVGPSIPILGQLYWPWPAYATGETGDKGDVTFSLNPKESKTYTLRWFDGGQHAFELDLEKPTIGEYETKTYLHFSGQAHHQVFLFNIVEGQKEYEFEGKVYEQGEFTNFDALVIMTELLGVFGGVLLTYGGASRLAILQSISRLQVEEGQTLITDWIATTNKGFAAERAIGIYEAFWQAATTAAGGAVALINGLYPALKKRGLWIFEQAFSSTSTTAQVFRGLLLWSMISDPGWMYGWARDLTGNEAKRFSQLQVQVGQNLKTAFNLIQYSDRPEDIRKAYGMLIVTKPLIEQLYGLLYSRDIVFQVSTSHPEYEDLLRSFVEEFNLLMIEAGGSSSDLINFENFQTQISEPDLRGKVTYVRDGDTIEVNLLNPDDSIKLVEGQPEVRAIRLLGVAASELDLGTDNSRWAGMCWKKAAEELLLTPEGDGKKVWIKQSEESPEDVYGRMLANVYALRSDVSEEWINRSGVLANPDPNSLFPVNYALRKMKPGSIVVYSKPTHAEVHLTKTEGQGPMFGSMEDDVFVGLTGMTIKDIPPGTYGITLKLKGYEDLVLPPQKLEAGGQILIPGFQELKSSEVPARYKITSEPSHAGIWYLSRLAGPSADYIYTFQLTPAVIELPPGEYFIKVDREGYSSEPKLLYFLSKEDIPEVHFELVDEETLSKLVVKAVCGDKRVENMSIALWSEEAEDFVELGLVTPETLSLKSGTYKVRLSKEGFETYISGPITLEKDDKKELVAIVKQVVDFGELNIITTEPGAEIYINGFAIGQKTPTKEAIRLYEENFFDFDRQTKTGTIMLKLVKKDFEVWEEKITLMIGEKRTVSAQLAPITEDGKVNISSKPSSLNIYINGVKQDLLTKRTINVKANEEYLFGVLYENRMKTRAVSVGPGEEKDILFDFTEPTTCKLHCRSVPVGAKIIINGEQTRVTNATVDVKPGTYTVVFSKEGYADYKFQPFTIGLNSIEEERDLYAELKKKYTRGSLSIKTSPEVYASISLKRRP